MCADAYFELDIPTELSRYLMDESLEIEPGDKESGLALISEVIGSILEVADLKACDCALR